MQKALLHSLLFFLTCLVIPFSSISQKDSLIKVTKSNLNDSLKSEAYYLLGAQSSFEDRNIAAIYFAESERLATKLNSDYLFGNLYTQKAIYYAQKLKDFSKALEYIKLSIEHFEKIKEYELEAKAYHIQAIYIFEPLDLNNDALINLKKAAWMTKKAKKDNSDDLYILGWYEVNMKMADSGIKHLQESYVLRVKNKAHPNMLVELLTWIGNGNNAKGDYQKAVTCQLRAAAMADSSKNDFGKFDCYRYAAYAYRNLKKNDSAAYYLKLCTDYLVKGKIFRRRNYVGADLVRVLVRLDKISEAEQYVNVLKDTTEFNYKEDDGMRKSVDLALFQFYKKKGDFREALNYLYDFNVLRDTLDSRKSRANAGEQNLKYEFQKQQEQQNLEQQQKDFESQEKLKKQKIFNYATIAVLFIIAVMLFLAYKIIKQKQIAFKEISIQKEEVEKQKNIVEVKNKEIHDSINYAKRLQDAILPNNSYLQSHFNESFIFYTPKDIVAGDFYFFEKLEDQLIIAAADCTGHGVPGALVSVVCSNALTRSIKEFGKTKPGEILNKTRELVIETFEKNNTDVKDGMDISLISIKTKKEKNSDKDNLEISWSGANNPLWYISTENGKSLFHEIKAHKQSIGKMENYSDFPTHTIHLKKGDILYLITDGYADQFGGDKGKKFKYKQLKDILEMSSHSSLEDQLKIVEKSFVEWKGALEQVDDVCIIGVRL